MLAAAMQSWFRWTTPARRAAMAIVPALQPDLAAAEPLPAAPANTWPKERLSVTNHLWGDGYLTPGGEMETLRLTKPLGLSSASSLLLLGAGGGGPAGSIVRNFGAWVTGLEVEPALVTQAQAMMKKANLGAKATIEAWDPLDPHFKPRQHHHCLAIEPLRCGGHPAPILDALSKALKLGGQLVMTELVTVKPLTAQVPSAARWATLEHRTLGSLQTGNAITRMLTRVGFDVRIVEDISERHIHNAMIGWRVAVREMEEDKPPPAMAAQLVTEAEIWLLRVKLLKENRLRMIRWHAISKALAK
jgi:cyclopropane fatty-acyl-phospholipid synthase-like methyltransferase